MHIENLFELQSRLASVGRFSQTRLNNPESVLEHSGCVTLTCYIFGSILIDEGYNIDLAVLLSKAITHDTDEIVTGDIARPTKYFNDQARQMFAEIELCGMSEVCCGLELPKKVTEKIMVDWNCAKDGLEGLIVSIADILAVVYKVHDECFMYGNKSISRTLQYGFPVLRKRLEEFKSVFPDSSLIATLQEAIGVCTRIGSEL